MTVRFSRWKTGSFTALGLFFWIVSIVALAVDDTEAWMVGLAFVLPPLIAVTLYLALDRPAAVVVDETGIRAPLFGWDVHWDEIVRVGLWRVYWRHGIFYALVVHVSDPDAVIARQTPRRRRRLERPRARAGLSRHGVRFPLHYLDTPRDEILAAVERYVPVTR